MGLLYGALGPGTTCWPGGGSEMLYRGGGQKMASRGGRPVIYPPMHTYGMRVDVTCPLGIFLNKIFAKANISNFRFEKTSLQHVYH